MSEGRFSRDLQNWWLSPTSFWFIFKMFIITTFSFTGMLFLDMFPESSAKGDFALYGRRKLVARNGQIIFSTVFLFFIQSTNTCFYLSKHVFWANLPPCKFAKSHISVSPELNTITHLNCSVYLLSIVCVLFLIHQHFHA